MPGGAEGERLRYRAGALSATAPGTRERQKQATREALVAAAHDLFTRDSYGAVGAEAIARAAGVSRATFYLRFRSKAEIVVDLMRRIEVEIADSFRDLDALEDPDPEAVAGWLHQHAGLWRRYRMEFTAIEQPWRTIRWSPTNGIPCCGRSPE